MLLSVVWLMTSSNRLFALSSHANVDDDDDDGVLSSYNQ